MPTALNRLDAYVLSRGSLISRAPFTFGFGGKDWTATTGARDTMRALTEGGYHNDEEFSALVDAAQFGGDTPPAIGSKLAVCVDGNGVPCPADEAVGERLNVRVKKAGRAGGGFTYTLRTATRG
jgi:hypothetical protein